MALPFNKPFEKTCIINCLIPFKFPCLPKLDQDKSPGPKV